MSCRLNRVRIKCFSFMSVDHGVSGKQSLAGMQGNSPNVRAPGPMQRLVSLTRLWGATRLKVSQELPSLFEIF